MYKLQLFFLIISALTIIFAENLKKHNDTSEGISFCIPTEVSFNVKDSKKDKKPKLIYTKNKLSNLVDWVLDNEHNTVGLSPALWSYIKRNGKMTLKDLKKIYSSGEKNILLSGDDTEVFVGVELYKYNNDVIGEYGVIVCDSELLYIGIIQELRFINKDKIIILKLVYDDPLNYVPKNYQKYFVKSPYVQGKWEFKDGNSLNKFYKEVIIKKKYNDDELKTVINQFSVIIKSIIIK